MATVTRRCTVNISLRSVSMKLFYGRYREDREDRWPLSLANCGASDIIERVMHIHEHSCTPYMCAECLHYDTCTRYAVHLYDVHVS